LAFGSDIRTVSDSFFFPELPANFAAKYEEFEDVYDPIYREVPPVSLFYKDVFEEYLLPAYFRRDPFTETYSDEDDLEAAFVLGLHDIEDFLEVYAEEFVQDGYEDEDEDETFIDCWVDYQSPAVDENVTFEGVYPIHVFLEDGEEDGEKDLDYGSESLFATYDDLSNEFGFNMDGDAFFYRVFPYY
jgi:hypothetical protein